MSRRGRDPLRWPLHVGEARHGLVACALALAALLLLPRPALGAAPDLVPVTLAGPASASTQQTISVTWTIENQGAGAASGAWQDGLYLSRTATCCASGSSVGAWLRTASIAAGSAYTVSKTVTVPSLAPGNYFLILWTDAAGALAEERDDNNQRATPITVTAPDLNPTALIASSPAGAGQPTSISWTVKNQGTGPASDRWTDRLYLSSTPTCCAGALTLAESTYTALAPGASYTRTKAVTWPWVFAGSYYLIIRTDDAGGLHEADEGNNQRVLPIALTTPDLVPTALDAPGTAEAGRPISVTWTVENRGTGPAPGPWTDKLYFSHGAECCDGATSLAASSRSAAVASGQSYSQTRSVTIPSVGAGVYHLFVVTDANGQVRESSDANNQRVLPITVGGPGSTEPSTLAITSVNLGRHPVAGTGFSVVVQAHDAAGTARKVTTATGVALRLRSGAGTLGGTLAGTIPLGASQVTIKGVSYTRAQDGVVLTASRTSGMALAPGDSTPFTVDPGPITSYSVAFASPEPVGAVFDVAVTALDRLSNPVTTDSSTVLTLRSASGRVAFDGDANGVFGDGSRALAAGVMTMHAKGTAAETTTITATDSRGRTGSASLTVTAAEGTALTFIIPPGAARAGSPIPGPPSVAVRDASGNTVTSSTASITIALGANPGGGVLAGTTTRVAAAGVATFGDLTISQPGAGYTLVATAPGLVAATSAPFTVSPGTAALSGRVTRAADGLAVSAAVVDVLEDGLVRSSTTTGPDGRYAMTGLAPGTYTVRASATGFVSRTQPGVSLPAGAAVTVNFSLIAGPGPAIRITSPAAGSVADRPTVLVRGDVSGVSGTDVGVGVNDVPGFLDDSGGFLALVPVGPGVTSLTAKLSTFSGVLATHSVPFSAPADVADPPITLRATPSGGAAPLAVVFDLVSRVGIGRVVLDADGDGAADYQGSGLAGVSFTLSQPGVYLPQVTVTDLGGQSHTALAIVQVSDRPALNLRLQAVWQGIKGALRANDVTGAVAFIHSAIRDRYQDQLSQLNPATLANVDQIMTAISLVDVGFGGAQCEMVRSSDGQLFSYAVWFQLDHDGLWRIRRF